MTLKIPGSRLTVQYRIYPSQRQMLAAVRQDTVSGVENSALACTVHQTKSTISDDRIAGVVFFSKTHITIGTVAHEMVHAADNVIERRRVKKGDLKEMRASVAGDLVDAFYKQFGLAK